MVPDWNGGRYVRQDGGGIYWPDERAAGKDGSTPYFYD